MFKPKYKLGQKLFILSSRKIDDRYNRGVVVGVSLLNPYTFGYFNYRQFLDSFNNAKYQIAYQDCVTERFCVDSVLEMDLAREVTNEL